MPYGPFTRPGVHSIAMKLRALATGAIALGAATIAALPGAAQTKPSTPAYYVSLGDSYSVGFQPGLGATAGYTGYVAKATHLTLANFGCSGATSTSIITTVGCPDNLPHTAGAHLYLNATQASAAEAFIRAHRRHIALITVSIGGNDLTSCAAQTDPVPCVISALTDLKKNVVTMAAGLRAAAGPKVPLIGLTYPDVILGEDVYPTRPASPARNAQAALSVVAFKTVINPALTKAYASSGGVLVDVTAATGAYTSPLRTVTLAPYGTLPVSVANVCSLTWFCQEGNIHATTKGYDVIGRLVVARYALLGKK